jgi:hypothetical protein
MNSLLDRHLLEHLCARYGSEKLPGRWSNTALAEPIGEAGRVGRTSLADGVRIPVADVPATDIVLDDPRDDGSAKIMCRGGFRHDGDAT